MGARQSRRSVDITTTPKKDGVPTEGGVVGDAAAPGDGKLERIEETDSKPISNGVTTHTEVAADKEDKDKDKDESSEEDKEKVQSEDTKAEEAKPDGTPQDASGTEGADVTTPSAEATSATPNAATSPESKETKKKDKLKKKWSFRSISFSKKDKNKPAREDTPKNGDVTKEEPLAESGEEVEGAAAAAGSPAEEKSAVSSSVAPEADDSVPAVATAAAAAAASPPPAEEAAAKLPVSESASATVDSKKEEEKPAATPTMTAFSVPSGESSSLVEKKEEPSPSAPTPVPVEEKKEEIEKVEAVAAEKVEVSPVQTIAPVEVSRAQPIATPSIIERKTSEDLPSLLPSSPPPTPIDPSPLQQAQQAAANASAIAEALKLPAEAAHEETTIVASDTIIDTTTVIAISPLDPSTLNTRSGTTTTDTTITDSITDSLLATSSSLPAGDRAPVPSENSSEFYHPEGITSLEEISSVSESGMDGISPKASKSVVSSLRDKQTDIPTTFPDESEPPVAKSVTNEKRELAMIESQEESDKLPEVINQEPQLIFNEESLPSPPLEEIQLTESIDSRGDLVIRSEEGPLPISGEIIVEAKPALVIPEHNLVLEDAQKSVKEASFLEKRDQPIEVILDVCKKQIVEVKSEAACPLPPNVECLKETIGAPIISTKDVLEDDVPPPLPDSPAPTLEPTLESFIPDEFPDKLIESSNPHNQEVEEEITLCPLPSKNVLELTEYPLPGDISQDVDCARHEIPLVCPIPCKDATSSTTTIENLPEISACPPSVEGNFDLLEDLPIRLEVLDKLSEYPAPVKAELPSTPVLSNRTEIPVELDASKTPIVEEKKEEEVTKENTLPTPPRSPKSIPTLDTFAPSQSFPSANASKTESSQAAPIAQQNTEDFKVESCDVSDIELKERLAQSEGMNGEESTPVCPFSKTSSIAVPENEQSTPEPEAAEKEAKLSANETNTTESVDEAPTSPPPAVPVEVSQTPAAPVSAPTPAPAPVTVPAPALAPAPAITEDVASVTKAIEEIDINEKAVAAAVNEAMESNTNELVNDSCHQNNMNE